MAVKIRQQAINFLGYVNNLVTMEQLAEDDMLEDYLGASQFFREQLSNWKMNFDNENDIAILTALYNARPRYLMIEEIANITGLNANGLRGRLFNLCSRGYINVSNEKLDKKKKIFYTVSVFGIEEYGKHMMQEISEIQGK